MLRLLSSRVTSSNSHSLPIWSCRSSDLLPQSPLVNCLAPKPTSMSPFLGVRFCSSTTIETPKSTSSSLVSSSSSIPATSTTPPASTVSVEVVQGLPHLTVPLPSRNEPCIFVLKPVTNTIGDLIMMLKTEDHGIDRVIIRSIEGIRIASTTSIQTLMKSDFDLVINDFAHRVQPPPFEVGAGLNTPLDDDEVRRLGDVRALVGELYEALHVEEYQAQQEQKLVRELEAMRDELAPLEDSRKMLAEQAEKRSGNLTWLGLGLMSVQFGILARLTWWEYSWDIMEPVTYFVTYGTAIACYAYFVLTRQDYLLPDVRDRQYLLNFHKRARKSEWDISKYNSLKEGICRAEVELSKLKDHTKLRPSNEALRKAAQEWEKNTGGLPYGGLLGGTHVNIGSIIDQLKGKFSS